VRSVNLVRAYNVPLNIEPEVGKVAQDSVEAESKVICDVLKDRVSGSKNPKGTGNVGPEVPLIIGSFQLAGERERLARVAAAHDVGAAVQVDEPLIVRDGQIADVRHVRVPVGEDPASTRVDIGHPPERPAEHLLHGHVEPAVPRAERRDHRAVIDERLLPRNRRYGPGSCPDGVVEGRPWRRGRRSGDRRGAERGAAAARHDAAAPITPRCTNAAGHSALLR
jgi:hypothetical protein